MLFFLLFSLFALAEERHALLIGNSIDPQYMLPEAEENVSVLSNILTAQDFAVVVLHNGSKEELEEAITTFVAQKSDISIFYYMGHGGHQDRENFFLTQKRDRVWAQSLFQQRFGQHLILFDANRSSMGDPKGWGIPKDLPENIMLSLATAPGMTEFTRPRVMSLYVEELSRWLPRAMLPLTDVLKNVHRAIKKRTDNQQLPVLVGNIDDVVISKQIKREDLNIPVQKIKVFPFTMGCTSAHTRVCAEDERPAHKVSHALISAPIVHFLLCGEAFAPAC